VSLPDQQLIDIVLKDKKPEKPPNMPAYGEKGVTTEQAAALVELRPNVLAQFFPSLQIEPGTDAVVEQNITSQEKDLTRGMELS